MRPSPGSPEASPTILRVAGLQKSFGGQVVLAGVDLTIERSEVILLRGENGSGKTTLINILTGNLSPDAGEISYLIDDTPRTFRFPRRWWSQLNPLDHFVPEFVAREAIGRTWQDVRLFASLTLNNNVAAAMSSPGAQSGPLAAVLRPKRIQEQEAVRAAAAERLLEELGLVGRGQSSADMVSLGQSKRTAIARAIAAGALVLFLDEPLAGLDDQGIQDVVALLEALVNKRGVTLIISEHVLNLPHLKRIATTDWLLKDGKIERSMLDQVQLADAHEPVSGAHYGAWWRSVVPKEAVIEQVDLFDGARLLRVYLPCREPSSAPPALKIRNLRIRRGSRVVPAGPSGFDFDLRRGELLLLCAPNGWGKTSLLECIAGLLPADSGEIRLDGLEISELPTWRRRHAGVRLVRARNNVFANMRGDEMLRLAGSPPGSLRRSDLAHRRIAFYSGGQRQMLALSSSSERDAAGILLLDEPFSMLDDAAIAEIGPILWPNSEQAVLVAVPATATI